MIAGDCYKPGAWNYYRIKCGGGGDSIQIWVNGHVTTDVRGRSFKEGRAAIQDHGKGNVHSFQNLRIRPLAAKE